MALNADYHALARITVPLTVILKPGAPAGALTHAPVSGATRKDEVMTTRASGTFEVKMTPQTVDDGSTAAAIGRLSLEKHFHGDLDASSKGTMLAAGTGVPNSAGYVALEWVSGTLGGRKGAFVLQHSGTMNRGAPHLVISVVPDSGTEELVGLSGTMVILVADGKHSYEFEYAISGAS